MKHIRLSLFLTFLKIGAFTFGGGYAMIPLIQKEVTDKHNWVSESDILDIVAIAESTPGPIAINAATFIGYRVAGVWGAVCATVGVVLPSFVILCTLANLLDAFQSAKLVRYAFIGIRAGVLALIAKSLYSMYRQCPKNLFSLLLAAAAFVLVAFIKINVFLVIVGCALAGLLHAAIAKRRQSL